MDLTKESIVAIEIKINIYFVVVKDSLIDEMEGNQKDLLERIIETKLTKLDTLKRNDEDYSLYLTYRGVPSVFLFRADLILEAELVYCSGYITYAAISSEIKATRSKWTPSGIYLMEYLEDEKFEEFRDETTVEFIKNVSSVISNNSHKLVRPILENCVRIINQDLSSGRLS